MDGYPPGFAPHWPPPAAEFAVQPPGFNPYILHPGPSENWSWTPGMSAVPLESLQQGQVTFVQLPANPAFSNYQQPVDFPGFPGPSFASPVSMRTNDERAANLDLTRNARGDWGETGQLAKRARFAEPDRWRRQGEKEPDSWRRQGEKQQKGRKSGADLTPVRNGNFHSPGGQQRHNRNSRESEGIGQNQTERHGKKGVQPGKQEKPHSRRADARAPTDVSPHPNKRPRSSQEQDHPLTPLSGGTLGERGEQNSRTAPRSSPGPPLFQLSTPLMRHSSPLQKSSPLADALKQKVQLWQTEKAGAATTLSASQSSPQTPPVNVGEVQAATPVTKAAEPFSFSVSRAQSTFAQDPVSQFVAEIKDSVSSGSQDPQGSLRQSQAPHATEDDAVGRSKPSIKERLSGLPLEFETQASELVNNPGSQTPLSRIKERLSFPTPQPSNPLHNHFPVESDWTAVNGHSSPVGSSPRPSPKRRGKKRSGSFQARPQGMEGHTEGGAGNESQEAAATLDERLTGVPWQPKDKEVWKIPDKLQKLLNEGLITDPLPSQESPQQQAVQALNLMQGAARLSKKQLRRVKIQAQESKELLELQNTVGMQNVPVIMQLYWEAKRPQEDPNQGQPRFSIYEQVKILRQVARRSKKKLGKLRKKEALQQQWTASLQAQRQLQRPQNDTLQPIGTSLQPQNGSAQYELQPQGQEGESFRQEKGSTLLVNHDSSFQQGVQFDRGQAGPQSGRQEQRGKESIEGIARGAESRVDNGAQPLRLSERCQRTDSGVGPASVLKSTGQEAADREEQQAGHAAGHQNRGRRENEDDKNQVAAAKAVSPDALQGLQIGVTRGLPSDVERGHSQMENSSAARTRPFPLWQQKRTSAESTKLHSAETSGVERTLEPPAVGLALLENKRMEKQRTKGSLDEERTAVTDSRGAERNQLQVPAKLQEERSAPSSLWADLEGAAAGGEVLNATEAQRQLRSTTAPSLSVAAPAPGAATSRKSMPPGKFAAPLGHKTPLGAPVPAPSKPQTLAPNTAKPQTLVPKTSDKAQTLARKIAKPQTPAPLVGDSVLADLRAKALASQRKKEVPRGQAVSAEPRGQEGSRRARVQEVSEVLCGRRGVDVAHGQGASEVLCGQAASELPPQLLDGALNLLPASLGPQKSTSNSAEGLLKQAGRSQEVRTGKGSEQHHAQGEEKPASQKGKDVSAASGEGKAKTAVFGLLQSTARPLVKNEGASESLPRLTLPRPPAVEAALKAAAKAFSPQRVFPKAVVEASDQSGKASDVQKQSNDVQTRMKAAEKTEGQMPTIQGGLWNKGKLVPTTNLVNNQSVSLPTYSQPMTIKQQKVVTPLQPVQSAVANLLTPGFGANLQKDGLGLQSEAARRDAGQAPVGNAPLTKRLELQLKPGQLLLSSPMGVRVLFGTQAQRDFATSTRLDSAAGSACRLLIRTPGNPTLESVPLEPFLAAQGLSLPQVISAFGGALPPWLLGEFQTSSASRSATKPLQAPQTGLAVIFPQRPFQLQSSSVPSNSLLGPSKLADRVTPAVNQGPEAPASRPAVKITCPNNQAPKPPFSAPAPTATTEAFGLRGSALFGAEASRPFISGALSGSLTFGTKAGVNASLRPANPQPLPRPMNGKGSVSTKLGAGSLGQSKQPATEGQSGGTSVQIDQSSPEKALAETIKALRESIQKQTQQAGPLSNDAPPPGEEGKRLAYIKKKRNVLVRKVTPGKNTMKVEAGDAKPKVHVLKTKPAKGTLINKTPQKKALSWQRTSSGGNKTARTPILQGPKTSRAFSSPQKKRLKWTKSSSSPGLQRKERFVGDPFKTPQRGVRVGAQNGKKGSGLVRRVALKWTRQGLEKRRSFGGRSRTPILKSENKGSLLNLFRQLQGPRSYASTYSKSTSGLALKRTGAVGLRGNLKWTLSTSKKRKAAVEEVVKTTGEGDQTTMSAKNRRVLAAARATARSKKASVMASLRRKPGAALPNRERVIPIGLAKYKMDVQGHSLVRVSEPTSSSAFTPPAVTPRRANVNGRTYVRQGATDRFVIDPASSRKAMASGRLKWSLQNARRRKAHKEPKLCSYFTKYGKCNREAGTCPFVHDPEKVAICTKFVLGRCDNPNCTLTHKIIPERMPVCSYFLEGTCTNDKCPFRHVSVAPDAPICRDFLRGFCPRGDKCPDKHTSVCPRFASEGECEEGEKCKFYHPTKRTWTLARALKEAGRKRKRARRASPAPPPDLGEGGIPLPADDESDSDAPPQLPKARRRYFEQEETEVARRIKPAFLLEES